MKLLLEKGANIEAKDEVVIFYYLLFSFFFLFSSISSCYLIHFKRVNGHLSIGFVHIMKTMKLCNCCWKRAPISRPKIRL